MQKVVDAAQKHNRCLARMVPDVTTGVDLYRQGFDMIAYSGDCWVLHGALKAGANELRMRCSKPQRSVGARRK
ncbi:MAG: hypothetical protein FJX56_06975 [Alphaproteobacteria bacterium]|nr:hypothetical protein [Alphaproteobacteria bacterium]